MDRRKYEVATQNDGCIKEIGAAVSEPLDLGVERMTVKFDPCGLRKFRVDPDAYLHELFTRLGRFPINSMKWVGSLEELDIRKDEIQCYHIVHPKAENSNTVCF